MSLIAILTAAAMTASPVAQARLADATCDRLAQGLTAYHADTLLYQQRGINQGLAPNPAVAVMTRRMQAVARYMAARYLPSQPISERDGILFDSTFGELMTEFERRCRV